MSSSSSLDVTSTGAGGTKGESGLSSLGFLINEIMSSIPLRDNKFGLSASTEQSGHRLCETSHLLTHLSHPTIRLHQESMTGDRTVERHTMHSNVFRSFSSRVDLGSD